VYGASLRQQSRRLFYLPAWNVASARPAFSKRRVARERVISCGLCHAPDMSGVLRRVVPVMPPATASGPQLPVVDLSLDSHDNLIG
jgi:hypothetical protein